MLELTTQNFEKEVLHSKIPVAVDFWATWCGPCRMIAPIVQEIGMIYKDRCKIARLNVDDEMEIATKYTVMNIPTIIFFKDGRECSRLVGVVPKEEIVSRIEEALT